MDKVCRITGNTNSGKNEFSSANARIEQGNEVKGIITKAVTTTIQHKDNKHALALMEKRTANKCDLQNILQAIANLSKRVYGLAIREGNKGDGGDNKSGGGGNNGGRCGGGFNHNTSGKDDNKEKTATEATKSVYTQQAWSTIPRGPIRRGNG